MGSGFPKSLNIGKAVDKTLGAEREVIATGFAYGMSKVKQIVATDQQTMRVSS